MTGPTFTPNRPLPRCQTKACVEHREEVATTLLVASIVALLAFMALVLVARALKRRGERAEARRAQEPHARAQDELEQLFDAPARKDGSGERRSRRSR